MAHAGHGYRKFSRRLPTSRPIFPFGIEYMLAAQILQTGMSTVIRAFLHCHWKIVHSDEKSLGRRRSAKN